MEVSTATASLLTGKSTKTLYRWIDEGRIQPGDGEGKSIGKGIVREARFSLDDIAGCISIPITEELEVELGKVEEGMAGSYNEIALMFFEAGVYETAFKWFEMAAKKGHVDAMDWLATCFLEGLGTTASSAHGIEWLGRAAAAGHPISIAKIESLNR